MDGLQAAILTVKIPYLRAWTEARQRCARLYSKLLLERNVPVRVPVTAAGNEHVWHLYVIKHDRRDELAAFLSKAGIQTVINYPVALPFLPAYERLKHTAEDFPNAFRNQSQILSLPIYPELNDSQIEYIAEAISMFDNQGSDLVDFQS